MTKMGVATTICWIGLGCLFLSAGPAGAQDRAFKGRIEGSFVAVPTSPAIYVGGAQAAGLATHIGAFTKVTSDTTNIATGEVEGFFTMTAANGDLVTGEYAGVMSFGAAPGSFSWVLNATITGGTGRFISATGSFVFVAAGQAVIVNGAVYGDYTEDFEGSISY